MNLTIETAWLLGLLLTATRLAGVLMFTPVLGFETLPGRIRIVVVLALSLLLMPGLPLQAVPTQAAGLFVVFVCELILGLTLGLGIQVAFAAFNLGGRLLDYQMGFAVANVFDPSSQDHAPLMGSFLKMLGVAVLFAMEGHHLLIQGVQASLRVLPSGVQLPAAQMGEAALQFGLMFSYGIVVVAPAVVTLLLVDLAIAVTARTMPQVNVYFVSLPLKVFLGLLVTGLSLRYLGPMYSEMFLGILRQWSKLLV